MHKKIGYLKTPVAANQSAATTELPGANSVFLQPLTEPALSVLLRLPQVLARFPVSRSHWYEGVKSGIYPKPYAISKRLVAWRADAIDALIARQCGTSATEMFNATNGGTK